MKSTSRLAPLLLGSALALSGCNSGDSAGSGTLNVALTDAPACGYDHVHVTVDRVRVHASSTAGDNATGWHEVVLATPRRIDLLTLTNGILTELGQTGLPAGRYQQVRLVLLPNDSGDALRNSLVPTGGSEQALATPSAAQSGYKVVGDFNVGANEIVDLVLDFDACRSIVPKGNGGYALKPVVTATVQAISGSIVGYVDPADAGATVYAERNGQLVKGTVADSSGRFVLAPVLQSGTAGYDVVIARPGDTTTLVRGVPVVATATTTLSTSAAPFVLADSPMRTASGTVTPASAEASVEALQAVSGGSYVTGITNATATSGSYGLSLPTAAPLVGDYTGVLPVSLAPDATAAGRYRLRATTAAGATQSTDVDLRAADATGIDFLF